MSSLFLDDETHGLTRRQSLAALSAGLGIGLFGLPALAADDTLERVKREKSIRLGFFSQAPWAVLNGDGSVAGEGPDVVKAAFASIGVTRIEPVVAEFAAMIPGLLAGRFDAVATGLYINGKRCEQVIFGNPDLQMPDAALVKTGNPLKIHSYDAMAANSAIRVGVNRGSVLTQTAEKAGVPRDRMVQFPDNQAMLAGLRTGRIDAMLGTAASMAYLLKVSGASDVERAAPFTGMKDSAGQEIKGYPAVAFRPADVALRDAYNSGLAQLRASGDLLKIISVYGFGETELPPIGLTAEQICKTA